MANRNLHTTGALIRAGLVRETDRAALDVVARRYATLIPPAFAALIEHEDDPIARQVVPHPDEAVTAAHEHPDPTGDAAHSPVPGIIRRYADRALLTPLLICPLYCRFCFRRERVGPAGGVLDEAALERALAWLGSHSAIGEVILTGGDPLLLSARRLRRIVAALGAMPHVHTIRIHSRVPVADPARLDAALVAALQTDRALWLVVHANHAREFTQSACDAIRLVQREGVPVLGQSVLLRGVNDSVGALEALFRAMLAARIKPYYLHHLDAAPGTQRFAVPIEEGRRLLEGLRGRVTGLAWPTYVLDIPGGHGKVPVNPEYLDLQSGQVRDPSGVAHGVAHELAQRGPTG